MKRALVSVTNKEGIVEFCKGLVELDFEIISTGGTSQRRCPRALLSGLYLRGTAFPTPATFP